MGTYPTLRQQQLTTTLKQSESVTLATLGECRGKSLFASVELTEIGQALAIEALGNAPDGYCHRVLMSPKRDIYYTLLPQPGEELPLINKSLTIAYGMDELELDEIKEGEIAFAGPTAADRFRVGTAQLVINADGELELRFTPADDQPMPEVVAAPVEAAEAIEPSLDELPF